MSNSMTEQLLERIVQTTVPGSRLLHTTRLEGGTSADMILLHLIVPDGQPRPLILRRPGRSQLSYRPNTAAIEYRALKAANRLGLPVPSAVAFDDTGRILSAPYLLVKYVEGR